MCLTILVSNTTPGCRSARISGILRLEEVVARKAVLVAQVTEKGVEK